MLFDKAAVEFEASQTQSRHLWTVVAWAVAGVACLIAVIEAVAMVVMSQNAGTVPYVVYVDKETGAVLQATSSVDGRTLLANEVMAEYWTRQYVTSRESYVYRLLQPDYDFVTATSEGNVADDYVAQFSGPNRKDEKLRDSVEERINIVSVVHQPDQAGRLTVRFRKVTYKTGQMQSERDDPYVATIAYKSMPTTGWSKKTKLINPLGFMVSAYRVSLETEVGRK